MNKNYDFAGWAARNDVLCSDGTTVKKGAFTHQNGQRVGLYWGHKHDDPHAIVGHCYLEDRPEGIYTYGYLNNTAAGMDAKEAIRHKDIDSLSIYANNVKFGGATGKDILHGVIREVSLVFAGADNTARIDYVLEHEESAGEGAIIYNGLVQDFEFPVEEVVGNIAHVDDSVEEIEHAEAKKEEPKEDKKEEPTEDKKVEKEKELTLEEVVDSMTEEQKTALYALVGMALEEGVEDENNKDSEEDKNVKHNVFETGMQEIRHDVLDASDMQAIFKDAKKIGSLRDAANEYLENTYSVSHAITDSHNNSITYGIADIDYLLPEAKAVTVEPQLIKADDGWVSKVMNGVHTSPFARIKSIFADITGEDARAFGYTKGHLKKEEVFALLKRTTDPQTIYKKQKLDRDDIIDITDFDVVAWLKKEMSLMLDEEKARAILVGDGRSSGSDDKISEEHIRPIWKDADLYSIKANVSFTGLTKNSEKADAIIDSAIRNRRHYRGSGNPTLFASETAVTEMLLIKDTTGRKIYSGMSDLATALRVKEIVTVPIMENLSRTVTTTGENPTTTTYNLLGIIVNLDDYTVGATRNGKTTLFEDFDIDYNQQKYLIEGRCSGALTKPASAIVLETTGTFAEG